MFLGETIERFAERQQFLIGSASRQSVGVEIGSLVLSAVFPSLPVAGLFDADRVKPYNKRLSQLQDHMGRFNDAFVAGALVDRLLGDGGLPAATRQAAAKGAGMVAGWHAHAAVADEPELIDAWRAFKRAEPFWEGTA